MVALLLLDSNQFNTSAGALFITLAGTGFSGAGFLLRSGPHAWAIIMKQIRHRKEPAFKLRPPIDGFVHLTPLFIC